MCRVLEIFHDYLCHGFKETVVLSLISSHIPYFPNYVYCLLFENCSSTTYLQDFKTGKISPGQFSKALGPTPRHLSSNVSKGFELVGFKKLSANSKAIGAK
jgi:hypothetical protein